MAEDIDKDPVFLGKTAWEVGYVAERYSAVSFSKTKERG
jgi:peptide chain release factor 3